MNKENFHMTGLSRWMEGTGPDSEIVLSSRVRLARNLKEIPFPYLASDDQREKIYSLVKGVVEDNKEFFADYQFINLTELTQLDKQLCMEKHIISPQLVRDSNNSFMLLREDEAVNIMINEEDHIRIQCLYPGLQLENAWELADNIDNALEEKLDYAFDEDLGYLTACPTNVGTGVRASLMMHLPGLVINRQINRILSALSQVGLIVRGLYGEGTEVVGNIVQISNQITLGQKEKEIIRNIHVVARQLIEQEEAARQALLNEGRERLADRAGRALGILSNARIMGSQEAIQLISDLRLGMDLGLIEMERRLLNQLLVVIRPAYLQKMQEKELDSYERDVCRATIIREMLEGKSQ
ncbi:MAG: protein arginine kinase [Candidatus Syntrophonatronum acetioxidans]|uniref:Protein-arginine kinase n=1 Tax=Candidatus Syntrophonatronum acetioxidans TaxID=1795816 RepID=A0A424YIB0_9FIRM|nr:MAG: protein arginine kinase [Candidatus Syntrophonatronum acetioxidans]